MFERKIIAGPQGDHFDSVQFFDKKALAKQLGVSIRTIDNLMARGMPHIKLTGKLVRFPRQPVLDWLAKRIISN